MTTVFTRRAVLFASLMGALGLTSALTGCASRQRPPGNRSTEEEPAISTNPDATTLLVFFSRAGENYHNGGRRLLDVGNTEVLADLIRERVECDVYEIEPSDPYPESYDETVERNSEEQDVDARPAIANPLPDVGRYDTVLIGSPVWNTRAPMIMSTFVEGVDLAGKTILPFVTFAVSGMSGIDDDYREALPASTVATGLAIRGEEVDEAGSDLDVWLRDAGLIR
ncbi:flavodoxin [Stackebrandtia soli]|uniref:flavodoxin n=1 Tax=Stackebrandtia soli TaxID=1892856 RepID=UPI0039EB5F0B